MSLAIITQPNMTIQFVKKRNGRLDAWDPEKINKTAIRVCKDLENVSASELVLDAKLALYDKVSTLEIDKALILSAREKVQKEPNYSLVAARILLTTIYREVFGDNITAPEFVNDYRSNFRSAIRKGVKRGLLREEMVSKFDLQKLSDAIQPNRDDLFKYFGIQTIADRYLLKVDKQWIETPQTFWMRVAMGVSILEDNPTERAIELYNVYSQMLYVSSTPTLFNAGSKRSQLSSCYLNTFDDSIDGIFDGLHQEARKSKFAGGLGFDVTPWRATGAGIDGTPDICKGIIPWLKLLNDLLIGVNQKGKRPGAGCAYLEIWHRDFERFLDLRKNTGDERLRTHDLNIAAWIPDLFMHRVKQDGDWYLFCPSDCSDLHDLYGIDFDVRYEEYCVAAESGAIKNFKKISAKALWKQILAALFETSHPWITFKDPCNTRYNNQHVGVVHSSNLCTEITLHTIASQFDAETGEKTSVGETAVCNLGSIVLSNHVIRDADGFLRVDWDKLAATIKIACRALDNVIDVNFYPTLESKKSNMAHRPVGLGVMGLHDMLHALNISIDSPEAVVFNNDLFEFISAHVFLQGTNLAEERGAYSTFKGSLIDQGSFPYDTYVEQMRTRHPDTVLPAGLINAPKQTTLWALVRQRVQQHGLRNALTMAIAPTATISDIVGCEQSIEPNPSVLFVKETWGGNFYVINNYFIEDMKSVDLWNPVMVDRVRQVDGDVSLLEVPDWIKQKYRIVADRNMKWLTISNAARQKWIDQSISFNVYYFGKSSKELSDIYLDAWDYGNKTTYYLRSKGASQIEKATTSVTTNQLTVTSNTPEIASASMCSLEAMRSGGVCEACQ